MPSNKVSPILPLNLTAPGGGGITAETSIAGDFQEWLFEANNAIFNAEGLLCPRRLFRIPATNYGTFPTLAEGTAWPIPIENKYFVGGPAKIYDTKNSLDLSTLANDGTAPAAWVGSIIWKPAYLNGTFYFFAEGTQAKSYVADATFSGVTQAPQYGIVHSAFGRLWASSTTPSGRSIKWSLLLNGKDWTSAGTGSLNLESYLGTNESITAISDFNGFLIVFTNKSILVFQNPFLVPIDNTGAGGVPQSMTLKEQIKGTGCVGMNAWTHMGEELIFMSHNGLKSLGRVFNDGGSNPLATFCPQINTQIINAIKAYLGTSQNLAEFRINYHPMFGFLTVETTDTIRGTYIIWVNRALDKGAFAVTRWGKLQEDIVVNNFAGIEVKGLYSTGPFYTLGPGIKGFGLIKNSSNVTTYYGLVHYGMGATDTVNESEAVAETAGFKFTVKSAWMNFGDAQGPVAKIPKDLKIIYRRPQSPYGPTITPVGTDLNVDYKLRFDYAVTPRTHSFIAPMISAGSFDVSTQYSPYNISPVPLSGDGSLVQWEIEALINNRAHEAFCIQRTGIQSKLGRINQGI